MTHPTGSTTGKAPSGDAGPGSMRRLLDASVVLHARADLEEVLARAAAAARELASADGACVLWLPTADEEPTQLATSGATPPDARARAQLAAGQAGPIVAGPGGRSWAAVPLRAAGMASGAMVVFRPAPEPPLEIGALETLADLTASGARNAFLVGQLRERTRRGDEILLHAAHEVRRPLTTMTANLELLDDDLPETARSEALDRIRGAVEDMRNVTDDVLSYERLVAGRMPTAPFDLGRATLRGAEAASGRLDAGGPEHLMVAGDERLVTAAIRNLVENAAKFSPRDRRVKVRWTRDDAWAHVSVQDQGPGIGSADLTRMFEPFQRLSGSAGVPGMGLGLSLVKAVAEGHGGHVTVLSEPGGGSTFALHLPIVPSSNHGGGAALAEPDAVAPEVDLSGGPTGS